MPPRPVPIPCPHLCEIMPSIAPWILTHACPLGSAFSLPQVSHAGGRELQQLSFNAYDGSSLADGAPVHLSNVTLQCDPDSDASFSAASAVAIDSPTFLSAVRALSLLGLNASLMVEGPVRVSNETGWPLWPKPGFYMGDGASLHIGSETGRGVIDFAMNADRIILPYVMTENTPGCLYINNLKFVNLCTTTFPLGPLGTFFPSMYIFGIEHSW